MKKNPLFAALVLTLIATSFAVRPAAKAAEQNVALQEQSEVAHVEKLFSGGHWTHPAPTTWSSRLEIRWNARWENAPQYAV